MYQKRGELLQKHYGTTLAVTVSCLLLFMLAPVGMMAGGVDVDIDFPDIDGLITTDQTWSGTKDFGQVTIQAGVNVTISPGTVLLNFNTESYIVVQGNLSAVGDEDLPITIGEAGTGWYHLRATNDGTLHMENCTVRSADFNVQPHGAPSYLKNVTTRGGGRGIDIEGDGHQVIDCTSIDPIYFGFYVAYVKSGLNIIGPTVQGGIRGIKMASSDHVNITGANVRDTTGNGIYFDNSRYGHIDGCTIENGGNYAVGLTLNSDLCTIENSRLNGTLGGLYADVDGLTVRHCDITFTDEDEGEWGMQLTGTVEDLVVEDCDIDNCRWPITCSTDRWSDATFRRTSFGPDVQDILIRSSLTKKFSDEEIDVVFEHCDLNANRSIVRGLNPDSHVRMVNSTWNRGLSEPFNLSGGEVNITWFLDIGAKDGNGDLTPCNIRAESVNGDELIDVDAPGGYIEDLEVQIGHHNLTESREVIYALNITSLINPGVKMAGFGPAPYPETILWISWDLPPTNSLPDPVTLDEDERVTWDLDDYHDDPEGLPLTYQVESDEHLDHSLEGSVLTFGGTDNYHGETWIKITATDAGGNDSFENIRVNIEPVNDPPHLVKDLPELITPEDTPVWIDLSDYAEDVEGDSFFWNSSAVQNAVLSWDVNMSNLTIVPNQNYNGIINIDLNLSDGMDWTNPVLTVNVTPVNDLPDATLRWQNGTGVEMVEYEFNETVNITVYEVTTPEDTPVAFWIDAKDVETDELTYHFREGDLLHGTVEVESYSYLNETNQTVTVEIPMNFTYTPAENDYEGDLVMFNVSDGEANISFWVHFRVLSVNDGPTFEPPAEWNITVEEGKLSKLDISGMIGDADGDPLMISVDPDDHITVNGTVLEVLYGSDFEGDSENVEITVSDGKLTASATLTIYVQSGSGPDDDEPERGTLEVKAKKDGWTFEIEGEIGQTLYIVVVDGSGNRTSYPMTYADGKYSVKIGKEDAEEGMSYYLTDEEDGESLGDETAGTLSNLAEADDDDGGFPFWLLLILVVLVIIAMIVVAVVVAAGGRGSGNEWDEE